jgi:hypothetical protein
LWAIARRVPIFSLELDVLAGSVQVLQRRQESEVSALLFWRGQRPHHFAELAELSVNVIQCPEYHRFLRVVSARESR